MGVQQNASLRLTLSHDALCLRNALAALERLQNQFVCLSVSPSVSMSHKTSWTLYGSQSSTDLHETCHQGRVPGDVVIYCLFGGNPKYFYPPNQKWIINPHHCSYGKISLMPNISKMVRDTMLDSEEVRQEIAHGLSIGTMTFDLGWPWTVLVQGHYSYSQIFR